MTRTSKEVSEEIEADKAVTKYSILFIIAAFVLPVIAAAVSHYSKQLSAAGEIRLPWFSLYIWFGVAFYPAVRLASVLNKRVGMKLGKVRSSGRD